ncbi:hypothetical protein GGF32_006585 [Allomyces javanicus]|nr:hypothetical protein GGF32_006585 [Allomyces javanicus]
MADAPAPPHAMAPLLAGGAARPPPAAVAAQLRALVTHAQSHHQATRRFLVERAKDAVAAVTRSLAELHEISTMVDDTAAVVPGLHGFADVLREIDTRSHAVFDELKPRWNAAAEATASADAEKADVAQGAGRAGARAEAVACLGHNPSFPNLDHNPSIPHLDRNPSIRLPTPRSGDRRPRHPRRRHLRIAGSNNSDDDDAAGAASDADSTAGGNDNPPRAHGRVPVRPIDATVLAHLALTDLGQLFTSEYEITQDSKDSVPLREIRTALGRDKGNGQLPWDSVLMASIGITKERARFCTACGHAPYTVRTRCCDAWTKGRTSGWISGVVVFGVRRRQQGAALPE